MTTDIQLLRSSVAYKRPAVAPLLDGQAAVNINPAEPGLFFKDSNGVDLFKVGPTAVNTTGNAPNSSPAGSTGNSIGESWLDGRAAFANPIMKVWDGAAWQASNGFDVNDITGAFSFANLLTVETLESDGTGTSSYIRIPQDSTVARATITAGAGMLRFNTTSLEFEGYNGTAWESFAIGGGDITLVDLSTTGNTTLGDNCAEDVLTINSVTSINCNTTIGASNSNTLSIASVVASDLVPDGTGTRTLGGTTARWNAFTNDLSATGNTTLGNNSAVDTVSVTATLTQNGTTEFLDSTTMWNSQQLRFSTVATPAPASPYVSLQAPTGLTVPVSFVLPDADGTVGQALVTDGAGNMSWASQTVSGNVTVDGLTVTGNTILGNDCASDTLVINAATLVNCDMGIGASSANTLAIASGITTNLLPSVDDVVNLGSPTQRWKDIYTNDIYTTNVYTGDLHLTNDRGSWTVIEEETYLSLRNNKTGKTFKLVMEAVD